jgi:glucuronoarabinoxylan endo-1,4-beta-xylanase
MKLKERLEDAKREGSARVLRIAFVSLVLAAFNLSSQAQTTTYIVDQFDPSGTGGNNYASGRITNVWGNWFGGAFQSLVWDSASDANTNPASGSMKITANFPSTPTDQFEVWDGLSAINPGLNGLQFTNFQCDVRFAAGSATKNGTFGNLQFGIPTPSSGQDYFNSGISVPANNTNWVHVSITLNANTDPNLKYITGVLIHIWGQGLVGPSTLWVDNIQFTGMAPINGTATINYTNTQQRIDGFGASSAWMSGSLSTSAADLLFSTNNGAGLSLLRTRIAPDGTSWETSIAQQARDHGARIWSTPWSPPIAYKDSGTVDGGNFVSSTANYQGYAAQLANYVASMTNTYGISLYAVSVQNEPDYSTTDYESCLWTSQQIHDFLPYLSTALSNNNVASTKIMIAEDMNWKWDLAAIAMNDNVSNLVGVLAAHNYGSSAAAVTQFGNPCPKPLWETEHYFGNDDSIANGVTVAQEIHSFMTVANANAYHYWWLTGSGTGSIADNTANPAKRLFTMGNYSRFVRPGYYRIGVTNNAFTSISAYKDTNSGRFAIVAINPAFTTVTQVFNLASFTATSVTPWITSSSLSLASQSAIAVANSSFSCALPAMSVVTFVGQGYAVSTNIVISSATFKNHALVLTWNATPGAIYSVLRTNILAGAANNWPAVITGYPPGGAPAGSLSYTDTTATASQNFYRLTSP